VAFFVVVEEAFFVVALALGFTSTGAGSSLTGSSLTGSSLTGSSLTGAATGAGAGALVLVQHSQESTIFKRRV